MIARILWNMPVIGLIAVILLLPELECRQSQSLAISAVLLANFIGFFEGKRG